MRLSTRPRISRSRISRLNAPARRNLSLVSFPAAAADKKKRFKISIPIPISTLQTSSRILFSFFFSNPTSKGRSTRHRIIKMPVSKKMKVRFVRSTLRSFLLPLSSPTSPLHSHLSGLFDFTFHAFLLTHVFSSIGPARAQEGRSGGDARPS